MKSKYCIYQRNVGAKRLPLEFRSCGELRGAMAVPPRPGWSLRALARQVSCGESQASIIHHDHPFLADGAVPDIDCTKYDSGL
jgi:hypothetical protein